MLCILTNNSGSLVSVAVKGTNVYSRLSNLRLNGMRNTNAAVRRKIVDCLPTGISFSSLRLDQPIGLEASSAAERIYRSADLKL